MSKETIFYCAARSLPVYYKVDPKGGIIECVKNWSEYAKAIDRFNYSAVFARELKRSCLAISREKYIEKREYVAKILAKHRPSPPKESNKPSDTRNLA